MSNAATRHFDSIARDRSVPGVRILFAPFQPDARATGLFTETLSSRERARAERIKRPVARDLFTQRRSFQRYCAARAMQTPFPAGEILFHHDEKGRPIFADLPGLRFSFAACRLGFIGAWSDTVVPGVDIENPVTIDDAEKLARNCFTPTEVEIVMAEGSDNARHRFCRLWCLKEAALKSVGEGLPYGLDRFEFELQPVASCIDAPAEWGGADMFEIHEWSEDKARAALVIRSEYEAVTTGNKP